MKPVLLDTNVLLDFFFAREPFAAAAKTIWIRAEKGEITAYVAATTIPTLFYLIRKLLGSEGARNAVETVVSIFGICMVDESVVRLAMNCPIRDLEDAIQAKAAEVAGIETIVTRDPGGFVRAGLRVLDPAALLIELDAGRLE